MPIKPNSVPKNPKRLPNNGGGLGTRGITRPGSEFPPLGARKAEPAGSGAVSTDELIGIGGKKVKIE